MMRRDRELILKDNMATSLPIDEQMNLLEKGAAEMIRFADLRERLEEKPRNRAAFGTQIKTALIL